MEIERITSNIYRFAHPLAHQLDTETIVPFGESGVAEDTDTRRFYLLSFDNWPRQDGSIGRPGRTVMKRDRARSGFLKGIRAGMCEGSRILRPGVTWGTGVMQ